MNKYMLDTDIVSYLWDKKSVHHQKVVEHLNHLDDDNIVGISVMSIYELTYGMGQDAVLISNDRIFEKLTELQPKFKYENWLN